MHSTSISSSEFRKKSRYMFKICEFQVRKAYGLFGDSCFTYAIFFEEGPCDSNNFEDISVTPGSTVRIPLTKSIQHCVTLLMDWFVDGTSSLCISGNGATQKIHLLSDISLPKTCWEINLSHRHTEKVTIGQEGKQRCQNSPPHV